MATATCHLAGINGDWLSVAIAIEPLPRQLRQKEQEKQKREKQGFEEVPAKTRMQLPGIPRGWVRGKVAMQYFRVDGDHCLKKFDPDTDLKASGWNENCTT